MRESEGHIRGIDELYLKGQFVTLRGDLDVPIPSPYHVRLQAVAQTAQYARANGAERVVIIGHRKRPGGRRIDSLSTRELAQPLSELIGEPVTFAQNLDRLPKGEVILGENLRFNVGEEKNSLEFVQKLLGLGNVYINEAFGTSHRVGASLTGLPDHLPSAAGFQLKREIDVSDEIVQRTREGKRLVVIMGGAKLDKLKIIPEFRGIATVLVAGALPKFISETDEIRTYAQVADLTLDGNDISKTSLEKFEREIAKADTLLWNGPVSFVEQGFTKNNHAIMNIITSNPHIFAVAGGGDIGEFIVRNGYSSLFTHIGTGGGSALEAQAGRRLLAVEKLRKRE